MLGIVLIFDIIIIYIFVKKNCFYITLVYYLNEYYIHDSCMHTFDDRCLRTDIVETNTVICNTYVN